MCTTPGDLTASEVIRLHTGNFFGEIGLLEDKLRKYTVTALERTVCLTLRRGTLKRLVGEPTEILKRNSETQHQVLRMML